MCITLFIPVSTFFKKKTRNYEGVSRRRNLPSLPAAEEPFTAGLYTDHQIRKEEGFTDHANHPLSPPAAVLPPTAHSPTGTTSNLENEHHLEGIHPARAAMLGLLDNPSPIEEEEEQCATKKRPIEETSDNDAVRDESLDANKRRKTTVDDHDHDGEDETVKTSLKQLLDFNDWHTAVGNFKDWVDGMLWG
ncbi:hypothetical protein BDB00DRAFT_387185 [Zychaea mexicana]|uniref:uncharacterized protein n=1 Tax=Zychaea mexicana TaxID=64656 RepID=UPI0022FEF156|nr:uncharacterized protein BDB00DRAFT_387185 [Zychaea mexicana]KAI9493160.1 hypothetical protein BDB00DRAFT_387185 [Zychaea mexicana]